MPEFGSWMIEAVPGKPYGSYNDPEQLLSCARKLKSRRTLLDKFITESGYANSKIISIPAAPILGTAKDIAISRNP